MHDTGHSPEPGSLIAPGDVGSDKALTKDASVLTQPKRRLDPRSDRDPDTASRELRFLWFPAVRARTGLSRSTIWRLERQGSFPRHRRISKNAVAWVDDEVTEWMRSKLEASA
jgi:prophage regulatory protein